MDKNLMKEFLLRAINDCSDQVKIVSDNIYCHPEPGRAEFQAVKWQLDYLKRLPVEIQEHYCGLETAYKAESTNSGEGKRIAFFSEYDALQGIGHACGHNLIAAAALMAFSGLTATVDKYALPHKMVLFGTPAEEGEGGKVDLQSAGGFANIDAVFATHPYHANGCDVLDLAVNRFDVYFYGTASHAASAPEQGVNALDAATLMLNAIACYRQQMSQRCMIHGIIVNGGTAANIIPDKTQLFFYLRAESDELQNRLISRFKDIVAGAALMTGCSYEISSCENPYRASVAYPELIKLCRNAAIELQVAYSGEIEPGFSTDYANVSAEIPGVNYLFDISGGTNVPLHSEVFRDLSGSIEGFEAAKQAAKVIGVAALEFILKETIDN